jgi:hypothetical protein
MTEPDPIDEMCAHLHSAVGPSGPAGAPPVDQSDTDYLVLSGIYRMGVLLWAAISATREDVAVRPIAVHFENSINPMATDLVWKARADIQWLTELTLEPPILALWSRNWFVRAGFTIPTLRERVLFATWWRRLSETMRRLMLSYASACRAAGVSPPPTDEVPRDCDLELARYELSEFWKYAMADAKRSGGHYYVQPSVSSAWKAFGESPTLATAQRLCLSMPSAHNYFVSCAPGGQTYELERLRRYAEFSEAASAQDEVD